jgi:hypothetical protein
MRIALSAPPAPTRDDHDVLVNGNDELSLADAAALARRSSRTVRRWTKIGRHDRGVLSAAHTVHGIRVRVSDLIEYMESVPTGADHSTREAILSPGTLKLDSGASDTLAPFEQLADAVARVVSDAPPLTDTQRERLAVILGGAR